MRINPLTGGLAICAWVGTEYGHWKRIRSTYPEWRLAIQEANKYLEEEELLENA